jgi:hypothetical protein
MASNQTERLETELVNGIVRAIEEKDFRAITNLSHELENLRRKAPAAHTTGLSVKEAAATLGLSISKMYELVNHRAMVGAIYVINPGSKNKHRRVDITAARKILQAVPSGSYYKK